MRWWCVWWAVSSGWPSAWFALGHRTCLGMFLGAGWSQVPGNPALFILPLPASESWFHYLRLFTSPHPLIKPWLLRMPGEFDGSEGHLELRRGRCFCFCFLLKYGWFTTCYLLLYSKVIQLYIYILFHILFHYGLSQDIKYSSLCYIIGPCCLSILHVIVFIC